MIETISKSLFARLEEEYHMGRRLNLHAKSRPLEENL